MWCRSPKTVARRKFHLLSRNPLAKNVVSIAQNCSETQILFALAQPSRYKRAVDRPKLWRNVNFILLAATLSSNTWCRSPKTVVKHHFFVCAKQVGAWSIDSYIFAHAAVAKRTLSHLGMHGAVVRRTFVLWWKNPLAGICVFIARNCGETPILRSRNCSAHCHGRFRACAMEL